MLTRFGWLIALPRSVPSCVPGGFGHNKDQWILAAGSTRSNNGPQASRKNTLAATFDRPVPGRRRRLWPFGDERPGLHARHETE
jgi:hypothetical protein